MSIPFFKKKYQDEICGELQKQLQLGNIHQVPKLEKIVINSGFSATREKSYPEEVAKTLTLIAGQRAIITKARKSISNFKLREGMPIGAKVTLRDPRMYDFLYRLIAIVLPNIRDFRGVSRKFDGRGNYTIGISDSTIFHEIRSDSQNKDPIGMDITIVTSANSDAHAHELLSSFGMPFRKITPSAEISA